jgi:signal transduction histidine kinase
MLLPGSRPTLSRWPYLLTVATVITLGLVVTFYLGETTHLSNRLMIQNQAETLARVINPNDILALQKTDADLKNPSYIRLKNLLASIRSANSNASFIRLSGKSSQGPVFFYVDSENPSSENYVLPGLIAESTGLMLRVFDGDQSGFEKVVNRWGNWFVAYAPIRDPASGQNIALVNFYVPSSTYVLEIIRYSVIPLLFTIILLAIIIASHYTQERKRRYLEEKDEFLSIASHEIRAPLTGLRWATENLIDEKFGSFDEETQKIVQTMHNDCVGLINNINNLLDLNLIDSPNQSTISIENVSLRTVMLSVTESMRLASKAKNVNLIIDDSLTADIQSQGNSELLFHLFANLVSNALKFTAPHTAVGISCHQQNGWNAISIVDQGPGLSEEDQTRIFGGFKNTRTLSRANEHGVGVGLYLAQTITRMHGGSITVASELNHGSVFTVWLPGLDHAA